jgi:hypothetical protein
MHDFAVLRIAPRGAILRTANQIFSSYQRFLAKTFKTADYE